VSRESRVVVTRSEIPNLILRFRSVRMGMELASGTYEA
jgi:hypothetical protein